MRRNEFENSSYNAQNTLPAAVYVENSTSDSTIKPYDRTEVEDLKSSQTIVTDSDTVSNSKQQLNPLRRIFILEPPIFLLNFATSLSCKFATTYIIFANKNSMHFIEQQLQQCLIFNTFSGRIYQSITLSVLQSYIWTHRSRMRANVGHFECNNRPCK